MEEPYLKISAKSSKNLPVLDTRTQDAYCPSKAFYH